MKPFKLISGVERIQEDVSVIRYYVEKSNDNFWINATMLVSIGFMLCICFAKIDQ